MGTLSATVNASGFVTVSGGPVQARCFGWVDVDQDEALVLDGPARQVPSERGHRFAGRVEIDGLRVVRAERFGEWTALVLPRGSRLLVEARVILPAALPRPASSVRQQVARPGAPAAPPAPSQQSQETARKVVGVVLALVLLDLFSR